MEWSLMIWESVQTSEDIPFDWWIRIAAASSRQLPSEGATTQDFKLLSNWSSRFWWNQRIWGRVQMFGESIFIRPTEQKKKKREGIDRMSFTPLQIAYSSCSLDVLSWWWALGHLKDQRFARWNDAHRLDCWIAMERSLKIRGDVQISDDSQFDYVFVITVDFDVLYTQ